MLIVELFNVSVLIKFLLFFVEKRIEEIHLEKCIMIDSLLLIKFQDEPVVSKPVIGEDKNLLSKAVDHKSRNILLKNIILLQT